MAESYKEFTLYNGKVQAKFYGPTPEKPNRHIYIVDGERRTGATTYIGIMDKSRQLVGWATDLARDYLLDEIEEGKKITIEDIFKACTLHATKKKEASDIGDEAHSWIEMYIKEETPPPMPERKEAQMAVSAFIQWSKKNKVKFVSSERVVYSKKHKFVGLLDIEAIVNGKRALVDIKTSNSIYNSYYIQTAAYLKADMEESGKTYPGGRWIIRLAKETKDEYEEKMKKKMQVRERAGKNAYAYDDYQVFEAVHLPNDTLERDFKAFLSAKALYEYNKETDVFLQKMNGK